MEISASRVHALVSVATVDCPRSGERSYGYCLTTLYSKAVLPLEIVPAWYQIVLRRNAVTRYSLNQQSVMLPYQLLVSHRS